MALKVILVLRLSFAQFSFPAYLPIPYRIPYKTSGEILTTLDLLFTGVRSNQDLIWCVKIGVYMSFCVHGF